MAHPQQDLTTEEKAQAEQAGNAAALSVVDRFARDGYSASADWLYADGGKGFPNFVGFNQTSARPGQYKLTPNQTW